MELERRFHQLKGNDKCMQALTREEKSSSSSSPAAPYFLWPPPWRLVGSARGREDFFSRCSKSPGASSSSHARQAITLKELMSIRAMHSKSLRKRSLGTAIGFRTRNNLMTDIPAIIVLVSRKLHRRWVVDEQLLPQTLQGPDGLWCDVDVVEFAYYGGTNSAPHEQIYSQVVEGVRGNDTHIGVGSQVAGIESYGTLGALVFSRIGLKQVGFLTNRHVAVDMEFPCQKMFHPLPPTLGPGVPLGVYLGSVERASSYVTDKLWYGIYASSNIDTFVRADGAFVPFVEGFDVGKLTTRIRGFEDWQLGDVVHVDLEGQLSAVVGKQVAKLGRSSGVTKGTIAAYSVEYHDDKKHCFFTDFLIVGDNDFNVPFDLDGDCGSMIFLLPGSEAEKILRPIGLLWGGTANKGKLKLRSGLNPDNWTSGIDLGRLLDLLNLDIIKTSDMLESAFKETEEYQKQLVSTDIPEDEDMVGAARSTLEPHCSRVKKQKVSES